MKILIRSLIGLIFLAMLCVAGILAWMSVPFPVQPERISSALQSGSTVKVAQDEYLVFTPVSGNASRGLILYPGAKTDPVTYASLLREIARSGILVVAAPMPFNTAFLSINRATQIMQALPDISRWYLAGHSLGGVAASLYADKNTNALAGLIFWAAYPAADLSNSPIPVLSVFARNDLSTTPDEIAQNMHLLPGKTTYQEIAGNHWQFGDYSEALNKAPQTVSRSQQQSDIVSATLAFINASGP